ncbi:MAG: hypothetical protein PGN13_13035 [Patulibacter minatonensis]
MSLAHRRLRLALRSRALLAPATAAIFLLAGAFFPGPTDPHESWALSAMVACALGAWFTFVVERAIPPQADAMLSASGGSARQRWRARTVLVGEIAAAICAVYLMVPDALGVFHGRAGAAELVLAGAAHLACAAFGGALALTLARPIRGGTAFGVVVATLCLSAGAAKLVGPFAGPGGISRAVAAAAPGTVPLVALAAAGITLAYAAGLIASARRIERWRG